MFFSSLQENSGLRQKILLFLSTPVLVLAACSGDSVTVTTESNVPPAQTADGSGAAVGVTLESADGSQSIEIDGGSISTQSQFEIGRFYSFEITRPDRLVFCLDGNISSQLELIDASGESETLVQGAACAEKVIPSGSHLLLVTENPNQ